MEEIKKGRPPKKQQSEGLKKYKERNKHRHRSAKSMAVHLIVFNHEREEVIQSIMDEFGYAESTANNIYAEAQKRIEGYTRYNAKKIAERNIQRLDVIAEEAYDNEDYKNSIKAMDILNKMSGQYETKVNVTSDTDKPFTIKLNN